MEEERDIKMGLKINTFSNQSGGSTFFKALSHPLAVNLVESFVARIKSAHKVALYDPENLAESLCELVPLERQVFDKIYVQRVEALGAPILEKMPYPITDIEDFTGNCLLIASFDAERYVNHISHLLPTGCRVETFDSLKIDKRMLTDPKHYLSPLNFATNFAFFREKDGHHTTLTTVNYWHRYGARNLSIWCCLFDEQGKTVATWEESLKDQAESIVFCSQRIKERFQLNDFVGQLFIHVIGVKGHNIIKYALDTTGNEEELLSSTHDANAWPAEYYAGVPAPRENEQVILWVQNSYPLEIKSGEIGLSRMGSEEVVPLKTPIAPYATFALDVSTLLPDLRWPNQIEVHAGCYFVRPRYEVVNSNNRRCIAHANVERIDLQLDENLPRVQSYLGKGYVVPAPILPLHQFRCEVLPTPMARSQSYLPLKAVFYTAEGKEVGCYSFGNLPRDHRHSLDLDEIWPSHKRREDIYGHIELMYDFEVGSQADGWIHGLFRYQDRDTGHQAETSFGSHIFNTALIYRDEPQSYSGKPPGVTTRLFLRVNERFDTYCHLIYPVATSKWRSRSATQILLYNQFGEEAACRTIEIPASGSCGWRYLELFSPSERKGLVSPYIIIRDETCRLFGYHGLLKEGKAFSLDHMFGF